VDEIRRRFEEETGVKVTVSPGGSNTLASQIIAGAPADLFLSANQQWVGAVEDKQLVAKSQHLLTNRLVLVVPKGNPDQVGSPDDLKSPKLRKLALAGAKVPAGMYADQALRSLKLLDDLVRGQKIARGHDVRVALTYVELGEASAGIVYATDASASPKVDIIYTFPKEAHEEIAYPLVLLKQGAENPAARRFFEYLSGEAATAVFERYGFERLKVPSN
jgi:molybdate transport system substrate-binding protein